MKISLTIILILFFTSVCQDNHTVVKKPITIEAQIQPSTEMELKYLNSQIQLARCKVQMLNNQLAIDRLENENILYGQSWEDIKKEIKISSVILDTLNNSSHEKVGN